MQSHSNFMKSAKTTKTPSSLGTKKNLALTPQSRQTRKRTLTILKKNRVTTHLTKEISCRGA